MTAASTGDVLVDPRAHADGSVDDVFRALRDGSPVTRHEPSDYPPFWSVVSYEHAKEVYTHPEVYGSTRGVLLRQQALGEDPGGNLTLALTDPPRHGDLRRILAPRFDERCARQMRVTLRRDIHAILEEAAQHDVVDFSHDVAERLSSIVIARLLGVPAADLDTVRRWIGEAFAAALPMTSHPRLAAYMVEMIYSQMEDPTDGAVGLLVNGEIDDELLSETEILLNIENLLGASENAGLSLASGVLALITHPDQWAKLRAHPALAGKACEEILRWASSATHSMRVTRQETELAGVSIPAGERVVVWVRSANRDERVFDAPDRFRVDRTPNRHLALGIGEHVCIGQTMARHQLRMMLDELGRSVESVEIAGEVTQIASIAVNGPTCLPVRIRMRVAR